MTIRVGQCAAAATVSLALTSGMAIADDEFLGLKLNGSFGENGFSRYVPAVTNPLFNETPFITTEAKPIYIYHDVPDDFVTGGGGINVGALQLRLALTDRLGFIATADGYTNIDFESVLPDDDGPNDVAFGLKYALLNAPEAGQIVTAGLRYTAPAGNLETAGIELNGAGAGFLNPFVTGAYLFDDWQVQGSLGVQIGLSSQNWSFVHGSLHVDNEVLDGLFPFFETNFFAPVDGGDIITSGPLVNLTGADIVDIGASDPVTYVTLGGGLRYRVLPNAIVGAGVEGNVMNREDTVFGVRVTADVTIHF